MTVFVGNIILELIWEVIKILFLKIVNQYMGNILEKNTWNLKDPPVMGTFVMVDMYIFIIITFLSTPLIKNHILRCVVYKLHLLLLLLLLLVRKLAVLMW